MGTMTPFFGKSLEEWLKTHSCSLDCIGGKTSPAILVHVTKVTYVFHDKVTLNIRRFGSTGIQRSFGWSLQRDQFVRLFRSHAVCAPAGDEELLCRAAQHAVKRELPLRLAAQLKQQLAAIIGQGIDRVDQAHARRIVEVRAVGDVLKEHQRAAVEVGLRNQRDELLLVGGPSVCADSTSVAPEP